MSDETIKAALEAAAKSLCFGHDGENCDMCVAPAHCYKSHVSLRKDAAAAIAAFLYDRAQTLRQTMGMQVYADFCEGEAADVERAAEEEA
jgi:hypothetical protein